MFFHFCVKHFVVFTACIWVHIISSGHSSIHVIFCLFQMYCRSSWFFLALLPELLIFFYMVSFMTTRKCFYNNFASKYTIKCCAEETHWLSNLYLRTGSIRWAKLETMQAWKQSHILIWPWKNTIYCIDVHLNPCSRFFFPLLELEGIGVSWILFKGIKNKSLVLFGTCYVKVEIKRDIIL